MTSKTKAVRFIERFRMPLMERKKTATTRPFKIGEVGDYFTAFGMRFQLTLVEKKRLMEIASVHYGKEGVESTEEFIAIWKKIHRRRGYNAQDVRWYHEFNRVEDVG